MKKKTMETLWGIDLGGTKTEGVVINSSGLNEVISRIRIPTESHKGYDHIVQQVKKLVKMMISETGMRPARLGMGIPGCVDKETGLVKNSNSVSLIGKPFQKDIEKMLGIPVVTANDANCFALAEAKFGIEKDVKPKAEVVFGVIMGTGVGGGIVVNGKVLNGIHGIAGEWGHNFLDESGGECYCGRTGCVETLISGPALEKYYTSLSSTTLTLKDIFENSKKGNDKAASQTIERLITYFGKAMAVVINILDPDAVVLGGGVGNIDLLYTEGVKEIQKHLFNNTLKTLFLKPRLGDSAGVFGAAALVG